MNTITICLNGQPAEEIEKGDFFHSLTWEALMPTINKMANIRPWERVDGIIISPEDIRLAISQKPGRKLNSVTAVKES